jgi:hypothetical protein
MTTYKKTSKKTNKTVTKAIEAKAEGKRYMASVVKSFYNTTYWHVVSLDQVITEGRWIPAEKVQFESGAHGRLGVPNSQVDWSVTVRRP